MHKNHLFYVIMAVLMFLMVEIGATLMLFHRYKEIIPKQSIDQPLAILALVNIITKDGLMLEAKKFAAHTYLPEDLFADLAAVGGGVENSDNPTMLNSTNRALTIQDARLKWKLRPGASVRNHLLKSSTFPNLDPPVLSYPLSSVLSKDLSSFIKDNSLLQYDYNIDSSGNRVTYPWVSVKKTIVVVGDSVAFGVGVADNATIASHLQLNFGGSARVVNLGVGGYNAEQVYKVSSDNTFTSPENILVYIASENDFHNNESGFDFQLFKQYISRYTALVDNGKYEKVIVLLHSYIQSNYDSIVHVSRYWKSSQEKLKLAGEFIGGVQSTSTVALIDFRDVIRDEKISKMSIFAGLDFYVDHCHMSSEGNRRIAAVLETTIRGMSRTKTQP